MSSADGLYLLLIPNAFCLDFLGGGSRTGLGVFFFEADGPDVCSGSNEFCEAGEILRFACVGEPGHGGDAALLSEALDPRTGLDDDWLLLSKAVDSPT